MKDIHESQEPVPVPRAPADSQFLQFLEAAKQLGENLDGIFDRFFAKLVCQSASQSASSIETSTNVGVSEKIIELAEKRNKRVPPDLPSFPADKLPSSVVVRLHFAEAMMVLLFNSLDQKQQDSVKQGFADLLDKIDISQIPTMRAYRDALTAMHSMLSSNPTPAEMAAALSDDFAKKFRSRS
jgi:hypothetical protein